MESQTNAPALPLDVYASGAASVASVPAQAVFVPTQLPPRPTSSPSTLLPPTSVYSFNSTAELQASGEKAIPHAEPTDTTAVHVATKSEALVTDLAPVATEDSAMAQLLASVEPIRPAEIEFMEPQSQREQKAGKKGKEEEVEDDGKGGEMETEQKEPRLNKSVSVSKEAEAARSNPHLLLPSPPPITTTVAADIDVGVAKVEEKSKMVTDHEISDTVTQLSPSPPKSKSKPVVRVVRKRRCVLSTLQMMRSYADTLQPVDCVILVERCSPFSRNTRFMEYFKTEFLSKILSDLNGGPPVDTNFGRDSYTSLYSLHTFNWRNPEPPTTLVSDTAIIKSIFTALDTLQPSGVPPVARGDEGIPIVPLLRVALSLFDNLETHRRRALGLRLRRRHLILLLRSPCATLEPLEAEAAVLSGEAVAESSVAVTETAECAETAITVESVATEGTSVDSNTKRKGVLSQLRELRVAVSIFSPCEHKNFRRLAQMCNMLPPDIRRDSEWPTVIFSREISQVSLAQRHSNGPIGSRRSTAPLSPQQRLQQTPPQPTSAVGSTEPSPRHPLQTQNQQSQQQQVPPSLPQQQQPPMVRHMIGGPSDCSALSPHQTRLPVPYPPGNNQMAAGSSQSHTAFSGPNSIEPAQGHHLHQGLQRSLGSGSGVTGPSSVPDALSNTYQVSPMATQGYGLAPPLPTESQVSRPPHQPVPLQQQQQQPQQPPPPQQQYYSPVAPAPYDSEGALPGLSPAMTSDPYLRVNYPPNPSPMCTNANVGINSATSVPNDSQSTSGLQNSSESLNSDHHHHQQQQQVKQRPTPQQQQPVPSPYAIPGTPHSAEPTNVQYHLRQHPSPYQAPQQSPMPTNSVPVSTVVGGPYHPPSALAYPMAEMSRYQNTGSPLNATRPSAPTAPPSRVMGEERTPLWEGQLNVRGQTLAYVQIFFETTAPRMTFPWQKSSCLMLQLEQVDRDSQMGQILSHHISSYLLPTKLTIAFKNPESQIALQNRLLSPTPTSFTVGILPPLASFNGSIAPGVIAFVCLLCTDDGHVIGIMPKDSETFRGDILLRQLHRCQRVVPDRQQQQYDASLLEMQPQQQQSSPAYSTNTPSLPNTPSKMVRPSTATPSPVVSRGGGGGGSGGGGSMPSRVGGGGGVMIEENEMVQQQQQTQHFMTAYQQMPSQQQQKMQQQQSQMTRQPPWQDQRQAGTSADLIQQQQQPRPYQSYQHPPQQQMMMSSGPGGQPQQQHLYQSQGVPMTQSAYMQQKISGVMPQQQQQLQRPQTYPGLVTPRQQLRDASGRFQSSSAAAAAAAAPPPGGQEFHTPPYPPIAGTPMYDMPQQYSGMTPTPRMSAYVRPPPAMRPGFPRMNSAAAAAYAALAPVGRGIPRGMGVRGISQPHLVMTPGPGEGMIYENPMDQQAQTQQQQQGVFEPNAAAASSTPHNQPPMF